MNNDGAGGICVLDVRTLPTLDVALVNHVLGRSRPATVRTVDEPIWRFPDQYADAVEALAIDEERRRGAPGRRPHQAVAFVLSGLPNYIHENYSREWDRAREQLFAGDAYTWLVREVLGPESIVAAAAWHRDETTGHLHVVAVPRRDGAVSWAAVRDAFSAKETGRVPRRRAEAYAALHDAFARDVGAAYGLARGERGSGATKEAIDRQRAAEAALEELKREIEEAEARLVQLRADEARELDERLVAARAEGRAEGREETIIDALEGQMVATPHADRADVQRRIRSRVEAGARVREHVAAGTPETLVVSVPPMPGAHSLAIRPRPRREGWER